MEGPAFWLAAVLAAALVGMAKGGLPVVGMLSVPVLALVISPVAAAGLMLPAAMVLTSVDIVPVLAIAPPTLAL